MENKTWRVAIREAISNCGFVFEHGCLTGRAPRESFNDSDIAEVIEEALWVRNGVDIDASDVDVGSLRLDPGTWVGLGSLAALARRTLRDYKTKMRDCPQAVQSALTPP